MTSARGAGKDDLIVVGGAGGFIAGALVRYFREQGFARIRAVDKKPVSTWTCWVYCITTRAGTPARCIPAAAAGTST